MDTPPDQHIPGRRYRSVSSPAALHYSSNDTPVVQPMAGLLTPPPEQQYNPDGQPVRARIQLWEGMSAAGGSGRQQLPSQTPAQQDRDQYPIGNTIQFWEGLASGTAGGVRQPQPPPSPASSSESLPYFDALEWPEGYEPVPEAPAARRPITPPTMPYNELWSIEVPDIRNLLNMAYKELEGAAGGGGEASGGGVSGEYHISSGDENDYPDYDSEERLNWFVEELRNRGLDINMDHELGSGSFGTVYPGRYTDQIANIGGKGERYLTGVTPDQAFAAKFVDLSSFVVHIYRMAHEVEKCILKTLVHPYIVSYRLAINLGRRVVLSRVDTIAYLSSEEEEQMAGLVQAAGKDIISYNGMFLIMDFADHGSLADFCQTNAFTGPLAVLFIQQLCNGLRCMQDMGVAHRDIHADNILVFSGAVAGDYAAKWTDFGCAVSRDVYREWGIDIPVDQMHAMMRADTIAFASVCRDLMDKCADDEGLDPGFRQQTLALVDELGNAIEPLATILERYNLT